MAGLKGLDKQDITFDFGMGTEQKADSKRVPIGALTVADNVMFTKDKALRRRYGTESAFVDAQVSGSNFVTRLLPTHDTDSIATLHPEGNLSIPMGSTTVAVDDSLGSVRGAGTEGVITAATTRSAILPACAVAGNTTYTVTAYASSAAGGLARVALLVQDATTKNVIEDVVIASGITTGATEQLRVFIAGSVAYVFYRDVGVTTIYCRPVTLTATSATASAAVGVVSGTTYANGWAVQQQDATSFYFVYRSSAPNIVMSRRTFASPGTTAWTFNTATSGTDTAVCLAEYGSTPSTVRCYYAQTGDILYVSATASTGAGSATGTYKAAAYTAGTIVGMTGYYTLGNATLLLLVLDATTHYFSAQLSGTFTAATFGPFKQAEIPCSGFFDRSSGEILCAVRNQGFVYIGCWDITTTSDVSNTMSIVARAGQDVDPYSGFKSDNLWSNAQCFSVSTDGIPTIHLPLCLVKESRTTSAGSSATMFGYIGISPSLTLKRAASPATFEDEAYFAGLAVYAGASASGVLCAPKFAAATGTAGSLTAGSTYTFYAVAVRTDSRGKKRRSQIGSISATGSTGYTVSIYTPPTSLSVSFNDADYGVELYCNPSGVDLWYKVRNAAVVYGTDTISFGSITTEPDDSAELLYTTGGAYENIPPALPRWVMSARKRLWSPSPENETDLFFSSEPLVGEDVRWSPYGVVRVPDTGGSITAVIEHNQRVVVFKEYAVYVLSGDGPSINGQGGSFGVELLSTSYGCESNVAVLSIPQGLLFKTPANGWWLLGNDYSFQYTGRGVDSYKTATVAASCVVTDQNQARFLLSGTQTAGGVLCYDYAYNQWTRFELSVDVSDMCVGNDNVVYYLYATTSRILRESAAVFTDSDSSGSATDYPMRFTTGWLNFNGVDGFQRVRYMDLQSGVHASESAISFAVSAYYDYDTAAGNTDTATIALGSDSAANRQANRLYFRRQKCLAVKIAFVLQGTEANIADRSLTALVFRVAGKTTAAPAASGQRSGTIP